MQNDPVAPDVADAAGSQSSRPGTSYEVPGLRSMVAGIAILLFVGIFTAAEMVSRPPQPAAAAMTAPAVPPAPGLAIPVTLEIPAIGVTAPVDPLGVDERGELQVPADYARVGWWSGGTAPGDVGPAVLVGHLDSTVGRAVFYSLEKLKPGDEIRVGRSDGSTATFVVGHMKSYRKNRFPTLDVYGPTEQPALRLVTCYGRFDRRTGHYRDNLVLYATPKP